MASELMTSRADFSNLGSTLSAIQQNARDDMISNNSALQSYNNVNAQIKASIPSSFGEIAFGAYELLGQSKDLLARFSKVKSDIAALPDAAKESLSKLGYKLGGRVDEATALATQTASELRSTATQAATQAAELTTRATTLGTNAVAELGSAASDLAGQVQERVAESVSNVSEVSSALQAEAGTAVSRFSLPLATKRPATLGLADTTAPENIRQQALRMIEPEATETPAAPYNLRAFQAGAGLQEEGSLALGNIARGAQEAVTTTLASTAARTTELGSEAASVATNLGSKVSTTLSNALTSGTDIVKTAASDVAETAAEVSASVLPVVGEVAAIGLGGMQIYEGFKTIFDHPSAAKPFTFPLPSIANVAQSMQSGI